VTGQPVSLVELAGIDEASRAPEALYLASRLGLASWGMDPDDRADALTALRDADPELRLGVLVTLAKLWTAALYATNPAADTGQWLSNIHAAAAFELHKRDAG